MGALEVLRGPLGRGEVRLVGTAEAEAFRVASETSGLDQLLTPIAVAELDREATRPVLVALRDRLAKTSGVTVSDASFYVLLRFAEARILSRRFPDKAVDLLSEAIAAAIVAGSATVEEADAVAVTVSLVPARLGDPDARPAGPGPGRGWPGPASWAPSSGGSGRSRRSSACCSGARSATRR